MANNNKIKKIKIKQSDGSFSDYYPIGVDAKNVDFIDGNNLEYEIKDSNIINLTGKQIHNVNNFSYLKSLEIEGEMSQSVTPTYNNPTKVETITGDVTLTINGNNYTLPFGDIEICGYDNDKDILKRIDGVWYKDKKIGIKVFTGTAYDNLDFGLAKGSRNFPCYRIGHALDDMERVSKSVRAYSNLLVAKDVYSNDQLGFMCHYPTADKNSNLYMSLPVDIAPNVTQFRNFLTEHPFKVYYVLQTRTLEKINNLELINALDKVLAREINDDVLNVEILVDNGLTPTLNISAYEFNIRGEVNKTKELLKNTIESVNYNKTLEDEYDYYDEITYKKYRYNNETDYYVVTIPKYDKKNKIINITVEDGGSPDTDTPLIHAQKNHTTFTCNGSLYISDTIDSNNSGNPNIISNGILINAHNMISAGVADNYLYLGFTADRQIKEYKVNNTTAQTMLNDGCIQVFDVYYKLIENGSKCNLTNVVTNEPTVVATENPRQALGVLEDGTILMVSCDGRTKMDLGLTSEQLQDIMLSLGCINAWNLDGGGSTSTVVKGSKINKNIDNQGTVDRSIRYTLNIKKPITNKGVAEAFNKIGEEKQNLIQQIVPKINELDKARFQTLHRYDLNTLTKEYIVAFGNHFFNAPFTNDKSDPNYIYSSGYIMCFPHPEAEWNGKYCSQFFISRDKMSIYQRRMIDEQWTEWTLLFTKSCFIGRSGGNYIKTVNGAEALKFNWGVSATDSHQFEIDENDNTLWTYVNAQPHGLSKGISGPIFLKVVLEIPDSIWQNNESIDIGIGYRKNELKNNELIWSDLPSDLAGYSTVETILKGTHYCTLSTQILINCTPTEEFRFYLNALAGIKIRSVSLTGELNVNLNNNW